MPAANPTHHRLQLLDLARGIAILAMVVFHVAWDLYYFGFSPTDVTTDLPWVVFQKSILTSFLLLVGAGLTLAHGDGVRWRAFWRRWALLVLAAVLVTAGTYWMFPDYFVFFGVLHAIALFSLLTLPILRLPALAVLGIGIALILVSFSYSDPVFTERWLAWIGFWPVSPPTSDVVPIFPWFGVVLVGAGGTGLLRTTSFWPRLAGFRSDEPLARGIAFLGRWSLPFYVLHQPVIIGVLWGLLQLQSPVLMPEILSESAAFIQSCEQTCTAGGNDVAHCTRYCACTLEQIEADRLWAAVASPDRTAEQELAINALSGLCRAMAK